MFYRKCEKEKCIYIQQLSTDEIAFIVPGFYYRNTNAVITEITFLIEKIVYTK